jgi:hypothetical protein
VIVMSRDENPWLSGVIPLLPLRHDDTWEFIPNLFSRRY